MFRKNTLQNIKDEQGVTTILMSFFVMSVLMMIALTVGSIMVYQIRMSMEITNSNTAFYAADAAVEKCLYQARKLSSGSGGCSDVSGTINVALDNGATGQATLTSANKINAIGAFGNTQRNIEVNW